MVLGEEALALGLADLVVVGLVVVPLPLLQFGQDREKVFLLWQDLREQERFLLNRHQVRRGSAVVVLVEGLVVVAGPGQGPIFAIRCQELPQGQSVAVLVVLLHPVLHVQALS